MSAQHFAKATQWGAAKAAVTGAGGEATTSARSAHEQSLLSYITHDSPASHLSY